MTINEEQHQQQRAKLLSPPISPENKKGVKRQLLAKLDVSSDEESDEWMEIKAQPSVVKKRKIINFLSSYHFKPSTKRPANSRTLKRTSTTMRESKVDSSSDSEFPNGTNDVDGATRGYGTRSKSKSPQSTISSSSSAPSSPEEDVEELKKRLTIAKINDNKKEYLKLITVNLIHDLAAKDIPDFEPNSEIDENGFTRVFKKLGFNHKIDDDNEEGTQESRICHGLKLTPQQLAETKKRFFAEKARKTYHGLTFKKTDAQKACKIDVNKASKIYEIYEGCGLLEDELYSY